MIDVAVTKILATRQILAQEAVGVLVGAALSRRCGIAEVDGHVGRHRKRSVLAHLGALGERSPEALRQWNERGDEAVPHCISGVLDWQVPEYDVTAGSLDDRGDRGAATGPEDEVPFLTLLLGQSAVFVGFRPPSGSGYGSVVALPFDRLTGNGRPLPVDGSTAD